MLLIPAIDLRNGRCVRLFQGDFGAETRYEHEPHELLLRYREFGASWLHVVLPIGCLRCTPSGISSSTFPTRDARGRAAVH